MRMWKNGLGTRASTMRLQVAVRHKPHHTGQAGCLTWWPYFVYVDRFFDMGVHLCRIAAGNKRN